jgi:hypothetical protein
LILFYLFFFSKNKKIKYYLLLHLGWFIVGDDVIIHGITDDLFDVTREDYAGNRCEEAAQGGSDISPHSLPHQTNKRKNDNNNNNNNNDDKNLEEKRRKKEAAAQQQAQTEQGLWAYI